MVEVDAKDPSFRKAELKSERTRVKALLFVFGGLLVLILLRGIVSLAEGRRGEAWPFVAILALMTVYEIAWLRFIAQALGSGVPVSGLMWRISITVESIFPTISLLLLVHSAGAGPRQALSSPIVLAYFVFIILSTLHLAPSLSRLCGALSAAGYAVVAVYVFFRFPEAVAGDAIFVYAASFSCFALLLLGGFAAAEVAGQIRKYVMMALREADSRARFENDLGIARSIQQGLLPKAAPSVDGFDIAGWNLPADETGGDYFDWQSLPDGRIAITIADVTGHGIGPALCMSACRAYARAGFAGGPHLQDFIQGMNQLLYSDLPPEKFVTMAAGVLDGDRASLELISAGHGPLLFYLAAEDRFRSYDAQGPPLGLLGNFPYGSPQRVTFAPDDILVLVTDGFIEWSNAEDEEFGQSRLKSVIRSHRHMSAEAIISQLYPAIVEFAGTRPQSDDLTVVIVKRLQRQAAPQPVLREK